jgi:molybdopterin molybdotransferase
MSDRLTVDEALAVIRAASPRLGAEVVPVKESLGRRLAEAARSALDAPRFTAAAMDGVAVRAAETAAASVSSPVFLELGEPVAAGRWPGPLAAAGAVPISTGAPVPAGADAIVVRERVSTVDRDGRHFLQVTEPCAAFAHIRSIGEDAAAGQEVLPAAYRMTPDAVGALTGYGVETVQVRCRPKLLLFTTGDELAGNRGELDHPAKIIDSNGPMVEAFAEALGLSTIVAGRAADTLASLDALLDRAIAADDIDITISTGGVSSGDFDLVRTRVEAVGGRVLFHGVRMRPGKPLLFATLPSGRLFFGLPGNPVAALVAMRFFVFAAIRTMYGLVPESGTAARAPEMGRPGTTLFLRGIARESVDGVLRVDTGFDQRSHVLSSVLSSDTWLRVDVTGDTTRATAFPKSPAVP